MRLALRSWVLFLMACGSDVPAPDGWAGPRPPVAADRAEAANVVEIDLVAAPHRWTFAPGRTLDGYAYNGSVPGPTIEAHVGDTIVVHFRNDLAEPTTIHWHGVRVPVEMDGSPHTQDPVPPGGTFEYRFVAMDEGTFWYHPHLNEPEQIERGLYGAIVVRGDEAPEVDAETVVMLDDLLFDETGALVPFDGVHEVHVGREGDVQLVNGVLSPEVSVRTGERQRWRVVNASNARVYRLTLEGHEFTVLGSDGGPWRSPRPETELLLGPGDRLDVLVDVGVASGERTALVARPYARGIGLGVVSPIDVVTLAATAEAPLTARPPYASERVIEPLDPTGVTPREITFAEALSGGTVTFFVNGETFPDVTPVPATVGDLQVWDLVNLGAMSHPFHLHGFFFQILERGGVPAAEPTWEDTFELRAGETVRIAFRPDDRPGMWMFHCHIIEHAHAGMIGMLHVH